MKEPQDYKRGKKQPNYKSVDIALDCETADTFDAAKARVERAQSLYDIRKDKGGFPFEEATEELRLAEQEYEEAKADLESNSQTFVFRSIGRKPYENLLLANQPTPSQVKKAKDSGDGEYNWNPDTFPIALIQASLVSPTMDEADIKDIWEGEDWSAAESMALFMAALEANSSRRIIDIPKESKRIVGSL